ncbi:MAG TPA: pyridoxal 5'-phosphate synthase glutaminase subunit PdxT [Candidatus Limnocylindrales bacterium]|nr:pyridoxal 5'-phosphate synthase glutaminase subunit PdxT [Candidatus Limnocylindrales bacterium]
MTHASLKIGILAIQGDFAAHAAMLHQLGADTVEVRTVTDLQGCDGLILPGGESTTQLQFLQEEGLYSAIRKFSKEHAIFGTCAGAILLAAHVNNPAQDSLKLLDITILRNGYGRQLSSDVFFGPCSLKKDPLEMVFIRGPVIEKVGPGITVLAKHQGKPVLVQNGHILAATFHPELTSDPTVHKHFLNLAAQGPARNAPSKKRRRRATR